MAHDLHIRPDGSASMMFVRQAPWHGLGTKLDHPATSAEAIKAAGLDWEVMKVPLYAVQGGSVAPVHQRQAVVRVDQWGKPDCPIFGLVGQGYMPLQNSGAFAFFDSIVGQGAAVYHTAGALGQGERVWILAKLPDQIRVIGDDVADKYLLLSTGHDGRSAVRIMFTPVRVVCQNTLTLALQDSGGAHAYHGRRLFADLEAAKVTLGLIHERYQQIGDTFREMTRVQMNGDRLRQYVKEVFPMPDGKVNEKSRHWIEKDRLGATERFDTGLGHDRPDVRGTLWAAYNGITEYVDHGRCDYTGDKRLLPLDADWGAKVACYAKLASGLRDAGRLHRAAENLRQADGTEAAWWLGLMVRSNGSARRAVRALRILVEAVR